MIPQWVGVLDLVLLPKVWEGHGRIGQRVPHLTHVGLKVMMDTMMDRIMLLWTWKDRRTVSLRHRQQWVEESYPSFATALYDKAWIGIGGCVFA